MRYFILNISLLLASSMLFSTSQEFQNSSNTQQLALEDLGDASVNWFGPMQGGGSSGFTGGGQGSFGGGPGFGGQGPGGFSGGPGSFGPGYQGAQPQGYTEQPFTSFPMSYPPPPTRVTPQTRATLIASFNQALKDPQFNEDFKQLIKSQLGRLLFSSALESDRDAQSMIKYLNQGRFQDAVGRMVPMSGPVGDMMQMVK